MYEERVVLEKLEMKRIILINFLVELASYISNTEKINIRNIFFFYTVDPLKENLRFSDQRKPNDVVIFLELWKVIRKK